MKALVIGGDSKLGTALARKLLASGHTVLCTTRRLDELSDKPVSSVQNWAHFDMLDPTILPLSLPLFPVCDEEPLLAYVVAAVTGFGACESDPSTWRVNADAPVLIASQLAYYGHRVVLVSSDAVERAPHTAYAMQKAHAELGVLATGGCVVRPARIAPEKYAEVAELLVGVGEDGRTGIVRW